MQLRHRVALDGIQLDSVDSRIMIQRVETGAGKENISAVSLMGGSGSRVTNVHRDSIDITVKFCIRLKKKSMAEREEVLEKANAWAFGGGWLTVNFKENRRIRVFRAQAAEIGDPWDWTKVYQIVFRACGVPYWQQANPAIVMQQDVSSTSLTLGISGSEKSVLEVSFRNTSGSTINTFSINAGESAMSFSSLGLADGETLVIDHDDTGKRCDLRLRILSAGGSYRSARSKRSTGSSNELTISPGIKHMQVSAGGSGKLTVSCYGRFA